MAIVSARLAFNLNPGYATEKIAIAIKAIHVMEFSRQRQQLHKELQLKMTHGSNLGLSRCLPLKPGDQEEGSDWQASMRVTDLSVPFLVAKTSPFHTGCGGNQSICSPQRIIC